jgi:glycerol-3-phosphate dehydrogenase
MQRNLPELDRRKFDVLVVGGGACGAATAREAALRGQSVALVERDDFGGGTSAHCFKVVHGGIRYLQHLDIRRIRASCLERAVMLRIAPHLVAPLPFAVPTYGMGRNAKWFLGTGMHIYDALTADLNRTIADHSRRIARTSFIDRSETLKTFPWLEQRGLSGAAVFQDGQMYNPPRLVLALVQAAHAHGAIVANYVEARRFILEGSRVTGVEATDRLTGDTLHIRARMVINAAGPWADGLLATLSGSQSPSLGSFSRDTCFLIERALPGGMAVAVQGGSHDADALLGRAARHMFLVPWRNRTLVGVWHGVVPTDPDGIGFERSQLLDYINEINSCYPALAIKQNEVLMTGFGLVPFGESSRQAVDRLSFGKESRFIDHSLERGLAGLITSVSVRYTVARSDARHALALASRQLALPADTGTSATSPVPGGDISNFSEFSQRLQRTRPGWISAQAADALGRNFGTHCREIIKLGEADESLRRSVPGHYTLAAEIEYVLQNEMAVRLADVLFRRTDAGTDAMPRRETVDFVATTMAQRFNWSAERLKLETAAVNSHGARYHAATTTT